MCSQGPLESLGGIRPDYLADTSFVYIDATIRMINAEGSLAILGFAGLAKGNTSELGLRNLAQQLPSWVSDYSTASMTDVWSMRKSF